MKNVITPTVSKTAEIMYIISHLASASSFAFLSASSMLAGNFISAGGFWLGKIDSMNCSICTTLDWTKIIMGATHSS